MELETDFPYVIASLRFKDILETGKCQVFFFFLGRRALLRLRCFLFIVFEITTNFIFFPRIFVVFNLCPQLWPFIISLHLLTVSDSLCLLSVISLRSRFIVQTLTSLHSRKPHAPPPVAASTQEFVPLFRLSVLPVSFQKLPIKFMLLKNVFFFNHSG